jgi:sugar phosphate isomerase/epimerase
MPGDGVIDLKTELTLLREKAYDKWLSLELFNADWWAKNPLETAKVGLERMQALCADAGISV